MSVPLASAEAPPRPPKNYPALQKLKDEELLARFVKTSEEGAFATLVSRYGSLVYGVCKRVLGNAADAEDAFQAAFLVLVKKGASLQQPGRLANWLYGVALRTASNVKSKRAQRARVEREANLMPATTDKSDISDMNYEQLWNVLDEEINQLPPKYALPLTLCYLEGKTNAEAATQLGWPEGSMSRRLSRAKDLLKARLSKRGMAMSAILLAAAMFARPASACAPAQLMASTVDAGTLVAEGARLVDVVSNFTANVTEEVALSLAFGFKLIAALTMAAASVVVATSVVIYHIAAPEDASFFLNRSAPSAAVPSAGPGEGRSISISVPVPKYLNNRPKGNNQSEEVKDPDSASTANSSDS
ncbi:MAG: RNA polymerase sigma factor [Pirellulaceae bacterium]